MSDRNDIKPIISDRTEVKAFISEKKEDMVSKSDFKMKVYFSIFLIMLSTLSIVVGLNWASKPANHTHEIEVIDEDVNRVLALTAGVTATSAVISAIPDDTCTPIADQIAGLTKYLLIVISILYLEKYLITLTGFVSFVILIPIAILILLIAIWTDRKAIKTISGKLAIFALILYMIVPTSVFFTDMIYDTYNASINETMDEANSITDDSQSFLDRIKEITTSATTYVSNIMNNFIESVAVLVVTSCFIPIIVILVLLRLTKLFFNIDLESKIRKKIGPKKARALADAANLSMKNDQANE